MIKIFIILLLALPASGLPVLFVPLCHDSDKVEEMGQWFRLVRVIFKRCLQNRRSSCFFYSSKPNCQNPNDSRDINPSQQSKELSIKPTLYRFLSDPNICLLNRIFTWSLWIKYILVLHFQEMVSCLCCFVFIFFQILQLCLDGSHCLLAQDLVGLWGQDPATSCDSLCHQWGVYCQVTSMLSWHPACPHHLLLRLSPAGTLIECHPHSSSDLQILNLSSMCGHSLDVIKVCHDHWLEG